MSTPAAKTAFAVLCILGIIAIGIGMLLELNRKRRGDSVISPRQLRLRLMSAIIWLIVLGSLFYAVIFLWPQRGDQEQARRFLSVLSGSLLLIVLAIGLLFYDFWQVLREGQRHEAQFEQQLTAFAKAEIARSQAGQSQAARPQAAGSQPEAQREPPGRELPSSRTDQSQE